MQVMVNIINRPESNVSSPLAQPFHITITQQRPKLTIFQILIMDIKHRQHRQIIKYTLLKNMQPSMALKLHTQFSVREGRTTMSAIQQIHTLTLLINTTIISQLLQANSLKSSTEYISKPAIFLKERGLLALQVQDLQHS